MIYRKRKSLSSYMFIPFLVVLIIAGCFTMVWLSSSITAVEYRIGELQEEKMQVMRQRKELIAKRAIALSVTDVEEAAGGRLDFRRTKVVSVRRDRGEVPYEVSLIRKR